MPMNKLWIAVIVLMGLTFSVSIPVSAQGNLLQDPSFEAVGDYKRVVSDPQDGTNFDVPPAWSGWAQLPTAGDEVWRNRIPTGFPHTGLFKIDGARSFHIARGFSTFTTAVFQTVAVPDKANVRGTARGFMERGESGQQTPGGQFRIGIDPTGGTNPLSGGIIWSGWVTNDDGWVQATVDATATGTQVTLFLYATQSAPENPNGIYWDDATLSVGGGGGTAPAGTPGTAAPTNTPVVPTPALASFVVPQPPQSDGSVVHVVQPGDTLSAIAVAYRTTNDEILRLNNLSSGRFLQIGQRLLIAPAPSGGSSGASPTRTPAGDAPAATNETNNPTASPTVSTPEATENATESRAAATEVSQAQPTATPQVVATVTDAPPAPVTEVAQRDQSADPITGVCVLMFDDSNQNRIREQGEGLLAGGTIALSLEGATVETYPTDGSSEPHCFEELAPGDYIAAATPPDGYGLTTAAQLRLNVRVSDKPVNAVFGAAQGVAVAVVPPADAAEDEAEAPQVVEDPAGSITNPLIQNLGLIVFGLAGFVILVGITTALLLRRR